MTIREWFDSEPMRKARMGMLGNEKNSFCTRCYDEQQHGGTSRRHKCNQKSVIFTRTAFDDSLAQSPGYEKFLHSATYRGAYDGMPVDLHIDLGNYCNLTCKMCNSAASSSIASQEVKWGIESAKKHLGSDWTKDSEVWSRTLHELKNIPKLNNVHFMGGETLLTKRFEDFLDFMIEHERLDLNFSFVTNGTTFNSRLMDKLKKFQRIGIEVSIESVTEHNAYQRQGTDMSVVMTNIDRYLDYCNGTNITITVRPAVSALTIGAYHTLLQFCMDRNILIKGLIVLRPLFLDAKILPRSIKDSYLLKYQEFVERNNLGNEITHSDFNESDPHQLKKILKQHADQCMSILQSPAPDNSDLLLEQMVRHCERWDKVHGFDARKLYPEFQDILTRYAYQI